MTSRAPSSLPTKLPISVGGCGGEKAIAAPASSLPPQAHCGLPLRRAKKMPRKSVCCRWMSPPPPNVFDGGRSRTFAPSISGTALAQPRARLLLRWDGDDAASPIAPHSDALHLLEASSLAATLADSLARSLLRLAFIVSCNGMTKNGMEG